MAMPYYKDITPLPTMGPTDLELDDTGEMLIIDWPEVKPDQSIGTVYRMALPARNLPMIVEALHTFVEELYRLELLPRPTKQ